MTEQTSPISEENPKKTTEQSASQERNFFTRTKALFSRIFRGKQETSPSSAADEDQRDAEDLIAHETPALPSKQEFAQWVKDRDLEKINSYFTNPKDLFTGFWFLGNRNPNGQGDLGFTSLGELILYPTGRVVEYNDFKRLVNFNVKNGDRLREKRDAKANKAEARQQAKLEKITIGEWRQARKDFYKALSSGDETSITSSREELEALIEKIKSPTWAKLAKKDLELLAKNTTQNRADVESRNEAVEEIKAKVASGEIAEPEPDENALEAMSELLEDIQDKSKFKQFFQLRKAFFQAVRAGEDEVADRLAEELDGLLNNAEDENNRNLLQAIGVYGINFQQAVMKDWVRRKAWDGFKQDVIGFPKKVGDKLKEAKEKGFKQVAKEIGQSIASSKLVERAKLMVAKIKEGPRKVWEGQVEYYDHLRSEYEQRLDITDVSPEQLDEYFAAFVANFTDYDEAEKAKAVAALLFNNRIGFSSRVAGAAKALESQGVDLQAIIDYKKHNYERGLREEGKTLKLINLKVFNLLQHSCYLSVGVDKNGEPKALGSAREEFGTVNGLKARRENRQEIKAARKQIANIKEQLVDLDQQFEGVAPGDNTAKKKLEDKQNDLERQEAELEEKIEKLEAASDFSLRDVLVLSKDGRTAGWYAAYLMGLVATPPVKKAVRLGITAATWGLKWGSKRAQETLVEEGVLDLEGEFDQAAAKLSQKGLYRLIQFASSATVKEAHRLGFGHGFGAGSMAMFLGDIAGLDSAAEFIRDRFDQASSEAVAEGLATAQTGMGTETTGPEPSPVPKPEPEFGGDTGMPEATPGPDEIGPAATPTPATPEPAGPVMPRVEPSVPEGVIPEVAAPTETLQELTKGANQSWWNLLRDKASELVADNPRPNASANLLTGVTRVLNENPSFNEQVLETLSDADTSKLINAMNEAIDKLEQVGGDRGVLSPVERALASGYIGDSDVISATQVDQMLETVLGK